MNKNNSSNIGFKIKELRIQKQFTLKQLSELTGLSIGFLSQLERGMSTIAIDSLTKVADVLGAHVTDFFDAPSYHSDVNIVRSFEKSYTNVNPQMIQYTLTQNVNEFSFLPREFMLLPSANEDDLDYATYTHGGEEFIHVLEGILTLFVNEKEFALYPGDSIFIHSDTPHNWQNRTNKVTRFLTINSPNPFLEKK